LFCCPVEARGQRDKRLVALSKAAVLQSRVSGCKLFRCPIEARGQRGKRLVALSEVAGKQNRVSERSRFVFRGCFGEAGRRRGGTFTLERNRFEAKGRAVGAAIDVVSVVKLGNRRSWFCFPKCRRGEVKARSFEAATPLRPANCGKSTRKRRSQKCCRKGLGLWQGGKAQCLVWREVVSFAVSFCQRRRFR
jgi:hypothetical protein